MVVFLSFLFFFCLARFFFLPPVFTLFVYRPFSFFLSLVSYIFLARVFSLLASFSIPGSFSLSFLARSVFSLALLNAINTVFVAYESVLICYPVYPDFRKKN